MKKAFSQLPTASLLGLSVLTAGSLAGAKEPGPVEITPLPPMPKVEELILEPLASSKTQPVPLFADEAFPEADPATEPAEAEGKPERENKAAEAGSQEPKPLVSQNEPLQSPPAEPQIPTAPAVIEGDSLPSAHVLEREIAAAPSSGPRTGTFGDGDSPALLGCPRDLLQRVWSPDLPEDSLFTVFGVEMRVLETCERRLALLVATTKEEDSLRERLGETLLGETLAPRDDQQETFLARIQELPPLEVQKPSDPPAKPKKSRPAKPDYKWFSMYGKNDDLKAGIRLGDEVWWVKAGDKLPGNVTIVEISGAPAFVRAAGAKREKLRFTQPPGEDQ